MELIETLCYCVILPTNHGGPGMRSLVFQSQEVQCPTCEGTGIYRGIAEPDGVGKVCRDCKGTAKQIRKFVPFTGRIVRNDVTHVVAADEGVLHTPYTEQGSISYEDFLKGKLPTSAPHLEFQDA